MASLGPELIVDIGGFPVTNTLITTFVVDAVIIALVFAVYKKINLVPSGLQSVFEPVIAYFYDLTEQISGSKAKTIFPWFASFFFFIFFANMIGLLPGFGTIGIWEEGAHASTTHEETAPKNAASITEDHVDETAEHSVPATTQAHEETAPPQNVKADEATAHTEPEKHLVPILRAATSDFNLTLALGTISIIATHIISIRYNGFFGYTKKFLSKNPINLAIGLLEFCLEGVKIFSLSFRLFGNIFAGEIVLITVAGLFAFIAPIPFLMLETIVALVQALVFAMLTMVFMSLLATTSSEGGGH